MIKIINFPVFDESVTNGPTDRRTEDASKNVLKKDMDDQEPSKKKDHDDELQGNR